MPDPADQLPQPIAAPKVQEARERFLGALNNATDEHVATIHLCRFGLLLNQALQRIPFNTDQIEQWKALAGFFQAVLAANDGLANYIDSPAGSFRVDSNSFSAAGNPPPTYRLGLETSDAQTLIDTAVAAEAAARTTAIATEATARTAADTAEASARTSAIAAEATARDAAIATAVAAEATARDTAIATATAWSVNSPTRGLDTVYTPSGTKPVLVLVTVRITCTAGQNGRIELRADSGTPSTTRAEAFASETSGTLVVRQQLCYLLPAGHSYDLHSTGSASMAVITTQEIAFG